MYSIADYARMIGDAPRMAAYTAALRRAVAADAIVADIGTGTGVFAVLAARMGARKVYAIEPGDAIEVARAVAAVNGVADRVEFIQAASTDVELPEAASIVVSDLRGVLPFNGRHIPSIADARRRLLAPGGVLIPRRDRLWAAIAEAPSLHQEHVAPWDEQRLGLDLRPMREMLSNTWRRARLDPEQLLSAAASVATLDYATIEDADLRVDEVFTASRAGTAQGIVLWFDAEIDEDAGFSNVPGGPASIYGQAYFPLADGVPLEAGERLSAHVEARLVADDYVWRWRARRGAEGAGGRNVVEQSTVCGAPIGIARLRKSANRYVPRLSPDGELAVAALTGMQGGQSIGEIALELLRRYPQRFGDWNAALGFVGELSQRYSH